MTKTKRGLKKSMAGILTGAALLAIALPVYADTAARPERGMRGGNMIESLVENGTISQSTYEAIETYMASSRPEAGDESEAPDRSGTGFLTEAVTDGIIDQAAADRLEEYMKTKMESRKTTDDSTARAVKEHHTNLWDSLLSDGVITQSEYDAIIAAMPQRPSGSAS